MKAGRLIAINTIVFLIIVAIGIVGINYYRNTTEFISTEKGFW